MRSQPAIVLVIAALAASVVLPAARAAPGEAVLAQPKEEADTEQELIGEEEEEPRQEQRDEEGAPAETGAGEGEQEGAATEGGPPWTQQMSWMALILLFFMILGMGASWYRLVGSRARRGEA